MILGADKIKVVNYNRSSGTGSFSDLINVLCEDITNRIERGIIVYHGNWVNNLNGYQAIICKSPYGTTDYNTEIRTSGIIFRYTDGSLHHFTANRSNGTWEYKIDL